MVVQGGGCCFLRAMYPCRYNAMALEEKYPGGYSPGCYDDEDEDDDEDA